MTRTLTLATLLVLSMHFGHCQDLSNTPAFEVASITPCKPGTPAPPLEHAGLVQFIYPGGNFRASATTVKYLLEWAYGIQPAQHTGGPSWMDTDRYDIAAKAGGDATDDQMKLMAQRLLAERFQLKLHHESKELSVLTVSVGKTAPKLFPPKEGETHDLRLAPQMGPDHKIVSFRLTATRYSLAQLNDAFARQLGLVIVNRTGFDGEYDFSMELAQDESQPNPRDPSMLLNAMKEQLGLTVKSEKIPVDILVIDSAEKVAAGN